MFIDTMGALIVVVLSSLLASVAFAGERPRHARNLSQRCPSTIGDILNLSACNAIAYGGVECKYNYLLLGCPPDALQCEPIKRCECHCNNNSPSREEETQPVPVPAASGEWRCRTLAVTEFCPGGIDNTPPDRLTPCTPEAEEPRDSGAPKPPTPSPFPAPTPAPVIIALDVVDCATIAKRRKCKKAKGCRWKGKKQKSCKTKTLTRGSF